MEAPSPIVQPFAPAEKSPLMRMLVPQGGGKGEEDGEDRTDDEMNEDDVNEIVEDECNSEEKENDDDAKVEEEDTGFDGLQADAVVDSANSAPPASSVRNEGFIVDVES